MDKKDIIKIWQEFADQNDSFVLTTDQKTLDLLVEGVLKNEKEHDLKYCPCQVRSGDFEKDLSLICPCNFFAQKTWTDEGRCWCGLFLKK